MKYFTKEELKSVSNAIWEDADTTPLMFSDQEPETAGMQRASCLHGLMLNIRNGTEVTVHEYVKALHSDKVAMTKLFDFVDTKAEDLQENVQAIELAFAELQAELNNDFARPLYSLHDWSPERSLQLFLVWKAQCAIDKVLIKLR